jgi:hypothetical protein
VPEKAKAPIIVTKLEFDRSWRLSQCDARLDLDKNKIVLERLRGWIEEWHKKNTAKVKQW